MSMDDAKKVVNRLTNDEEFRNKVMAVEDLGERIRLIELEGYKIDTQEIQDVLEDNDLEHISGGRPAGRAPRW